MASDFACAANRGRHNVRMKYYWDFFGPNSGRTAEHFRKHLIQFLREHGLEEVVTGCESEGHSHMAAYCVVSSAHAETLERALKPNRKVPTAT